MDSRIKLLDLQSFKHLVTMTIQARHMNPTMELPPALKHLRVLFKSASQTTPKLLPSGVADYVHGVAESRRRRCLTLQSVVFEGGSFKQEERENTGDLFSDSEGRASIIRVELRARSLVWRFGGVDFTLRRISLPDDRQWRWTLL